MLVTDEAKQRRAGHHPWQPRFGERTLHLGM